MAEICTAHWDVPVALMAGLAAHTHRVEQYPKLPSSTSTPSLPSLHTPAGSTAVLFPWRAVQAWGIACC